MLTLNVVAAQANSSMMWRCRVHAVAATAPNAVRCCRTKFRKLSGARPLAAARAEGSVSIRAIVVLSAIVLAWVGRCWIIQSAVAGGDRQHPWTVFSADPSDPRRADRPGVGCGQRGRAWRAAAGPRARNRL